MNGRVHLTLGVGVGLWAVAGVCVWVEWICLLGCSFLSTGGIYPPHRFALPLTEYSYSMWSLLQSCIKSVICFDNSRDWCRGVDDHEACIFYYIWFILCAPSS